MLLFSFQHASVHIVLLFETLSHNRAIKALLTVKCMFVSCGRGGSSRFAVRFQNGCQWPTCQSPFVPINPSVISYPWASSPLCLTDGYLDSHWAISSNAGDKKINIWNSDSDAFIWNWSTQNCSLHECRFEKLTVSLECFVFGQIYL